MLLLVKHNIPPVGLHYPQLGNIDCLPTLMIDRTVIEVNNHFDEDLICFQHW